ncbi:MAG: ABC transporter substrate-binding protein [Chloroflexi bacterium]|nr:ABC transporter substrate-binding protein [Chloroflexota bacterium]
MNGKLSHRRWMIVPLLLTLAIINSACRVQTPAAASVAPTVIRVGYFPNITHSQALIGLARGDFQEALGKNVTIQTTLFNAGPSVIEALFAGQIDLAYIGPNPAINGYVQSKGEALRIVAGATSGGAALVVRPTANIKVPADLAGKRLASPQLGNTQDVALRNYLIVHGLNSVEKGGNVEVIPTQNPQILDLFKQGQIDGAWVPEPWASRLIVEGGGALFLDERDLWPRGDFVTAHIIVSTTFLKAHPELVKAWLAAHVAVTQWEVDHPTDAQAILNTQIGELTGKKLNDEVLSQAWARMRATWDPISASLLQSADSAYAAGFLKEKPNLGGIYDLTLLNEVLRARGLAEVR